MHYGVEYCTTERYNGKPVYTKLVYCGASMGGEKFVKHGIPAGFKAIRSVGTLGMYVLPAGIEISLEHGETHRVLDENIMLKTRSNHDGLQTAVQIWYTK